MPVSPVGRSRFFTATPRSGISTQSRWSEITTPEAVLDIAKRVKLALDEGGEPRYPGTSRFFAGQRDAVSPTNETVLCAICLDSISSVDRCELDVCLHTFCFTCIAQWARVSNTCPLCKRKIYLIREKCSKNEHVVPT